MFWSVFGIPTDGEDKGQIKTKTQVWKSQGICKNSITGEINQGKIKEFYFGLCLMNMSMYGKFWWIWACMTSSDEPTNHNIQWQEFNPFQ